LNEKIAAFGLIILAIALCGVFGWIKYQDHRKEAQREVWEAENEVARAVLAEKRKRESAEKKKAAASARAEKEKEPIPDSLSGSWTWKPADQTAIFFTLENASGGFIMRQEFLDGSRTEQGVTAKREGGTIVLRAKEENSTGDHWVLSEEMNLIVRDREGIVGMATPKSPPLEIKGIRTGMTKEEVAAAIGSIEDFTIAGVKGKYPPSLKYGEDGRLDELWFYFEGGFATVLGALRAKYPALDSDDGTTFILRGDEATIQLSERHSASVLILSSLRALNEREQAAIEKRKDI
jgi:hypothetical protein